MSKIRGLAPLIFWVAFTAVCGTVLIGTSAYLYLAPALPSVEQLRDVSFQIPLKVYTRDEKLIGEFGEKRRTPIHFDEIPPDLINAIVAAEDDRFFRHKGIDYSGLARAAYELLRYQEIRSGGSTITMQVARNFFLDRAQKFTRKFNEILLARQIERELTKKEIFELYVNKIYLGHRSYGVVAAAEVYYGKPLQELTLAQMAMIAGLPKAPSAYNPITNAARAMTRRDWILRRMLELGSIDEARYTQARAEANTARFHGLSSEVDALHVADMVRTYMLEQYGNESTDQGYRVYTTIESPLQRAATDATFLGLMAYDRRHGWRGAEKHIDPRTLVAAPGSDGKQAPWPESLQDVRQVSYLEPGIVIATDKDSVTVLRRAGDTVKIPFSTMGWARKYLGVDAMGPAPKTPADVVRPGDVVRVYAQKAPKGGKDYVWQLGQVPAVQAALVSVRPEDGSIAALVGGFSYTQSRFNRAIQGDRQAGSSFKPIVYAAALDRGFTPASIINDAPIVLEDAGMDKAWRPENDNGSFYGPMRLRQALYLSRNLVSIRIMMQLPIDYVIDYASNLGVKRDKLPRNFSLALGTGSISPLEIANAYSVFASGGYRTSPYLIDRIEDNAGNVIWKAEPLRVCRSCPEGSTGHAPRVMDERTAYIMNSILQDVVRRGTATRALSLGRDDLAGKTGTTNETRDAWFAGYNPTLVSAVWVGFDEPQTLGRTEYGGVAALPIWIDYMRVALAGKPSAYLPQPPGIVTVKIDPATGERARPGQPDAIFELFKEENVPADRSTGNGGETGDMSVEQIF
ncbi:MAG: penicillin-binding protein 1A [Pseudomonadota bacterium]